MDFIYEYPPNLCKPQTVFRKKFSRSFMRCHMNHSREGLAIILELG